MDLFNDITIASDDELGNFTPAADIAAAAAPASSDSNEEGDKGGQQAPAEGAAAPVGGMLSDEELAATGITNPAPAAEGGAPPANDTGTPAPATGNLQLLAKSLVEAKGLEISDEDLKSINSAKDLVNVLDKQISSRAEKQATELHDSWRGSLTDKQKQALDMIEAGVEADSAKSLAENVSYYNSLTDEAIKEDPEKGREIYRGLLQMEGITNTARIEELVEEAEALNKLDDKIAGGREKIVKHLNDSIKNVTEQASQSVKNQEQKNIEAREAFETAIKDAKEIVPGMPFTQDIRDQMLKNSKPTVSVNGRMVPQFTAKAMQYKQGINTLLHYYETLGLFDLDENGNPKVDFSKISAKAQSTALDNLENTLRNDNAPGMAGAGNRELAPPVPNTSGDGEDNTIANLKSILGNV